VAASPGTNRPVPSRCETTRGGEKIWLAVRFVMVTVTDCTDVASGCAGDVGGGGVTRASDARVRAATVGR
jgi:hypothetical protein